MTGNGHGAVQVRVRAVRLVTVPEGATGGPGGPGVAMTWLINIELHLNLTLYNQYADFIRSHA